MSLQYGKLCSLLLLEHFGPIVQTVGDDLFKHGLKPLGSIRSITGFPLNKVKEALCVLIKYGFVVYQQNAKGVGYTILPDRIIMMLRYPRYMFLVKTFCGDEAEMMLEEILRRGFETASQVIVTTHQRLEQISSEHQPSVPLLKEKFELLVKNQFLMRSVSSEITEETNTEKADFNFPDLDVRAIAAMIKGTSADPGTSGTSADPGDNAIYWRINFDRFTQDLRDQVMVAAMSKRLDENAGELMRQLLYLMYLRTASWADTSNPIPYAEIKEAVRKLNFPLLIQYLDQYLRLIEEDSSQFIKRVGDTGGGQFSINMKEAFNQLAWTTLENIVMERFGSKAARIFRLVRTKKYVEQEQIQQLAMIPAKEAKHLTYTLLQENYLQMQELKKAGVSNAPTKIFFLFHIDLNQVVRMEIEHCYQALYNTLQRRDHESSANRRMIDKQLRIHTLTSNLREHGATEEQLAEVPNNELYFLINICYESHDNVALQIILCHLVCAHRSNEQIAEMITPSEKLQLEKVQGTIKKLGSGELQIDETLFLLTMYLKYQ